MKKIGWIWTMLFLGIVGPLVAQSDIAEPVRFAHVNRDRAAMQELYRKMYEPARDHQEGWVDKGNCEAGTLPAATLKARLQELNYFRKMAGLYPVTLNAEFNKYAQAAAFLMRQNGTLSHHPPTTWKCYSELGAKGAGSCNLGYGGGILGYMTDWGASNQDCGHRMWILSALKEQLGYGGTDATDAIYVFGPTTKRDSLPEYVAWPPAGFVPQEIIDSRWTISIPGVYAKYDKATVTVTADGKNVPLIYAKPTSYGDGGLAFELDNFEDLETRMLDKKIKVSVKNIMVGNEIHQFSYEVVLFVAREKPVYVADAEANDGDRVEFTLGKADEEWCHLRSRLALTLRD
jgi:Cysteine-rich secretory protein family